MGDILLPTVSSTGVVPTPVDSNISREQSGDLHASLDRVAKSLGEIRLLEICSITLFQIHVREASQIKNRRKVAT